MLKRNMMVWAVVSVMVAPMTNVTVQAQTPFRIRLLEETQVAEDGLFFAGEKGEDYHFSVTLKSGRLTIQSAPEGTDDWSVLYQVTTGRQYRFFTSLLVDDYLVVYLMEKASGDAQPLYLQVYTLDDVVPEP